MGDCLSPPVLLFILLEPFQCHHIIFKALSKVYFSQKRVLILIKTPLVVLRQRLNQLRLVDLEPNFSNDEEEDDGVEGEARGDSCSARWSSLVDVVFGAFLTFINILHHPHLQTRDAGVDFFGTLVLAKGREIAHKEFTGAWVGRDGVGRLFLVKLNEPALLEEFQGDGGHAEGGSSKEDVLEGGVHTGKICFKLNN